MKKESISKKIDCVRDVKNQIWTAFMLSLGSAIALSSHLNNSYDKFLCYTGAILALLLFFIYFKKDDQISILVDKLEKEN